MNRSVRVLIVEDLPDDVELIERELTRTGVCFESIVVSDSREFTRAFETFKPDIVLSDHMLPRFNSIEALEICNTYKNAMGIEVPFVIVSGGVPMAFGEECIKFGADDFVRKDQLKRLGPCVTSLLKKYREVRGTEVRRCGVS